jgi:hypothetical protein
MVLRSLARHPAFLPLVAAFAVLVTAIVLQLASAAEQQAQVTPSPRDARAAGAPGSAARLSGTIVEVQLARDGAPTDRVRVRPVNGGEAMWATLRPESRVAVPLGDQHAVGTALDLEAGQAVELEYAAGAAARDGAPVASLRVAGPPDSASFD